MMTPLLPYYRKRILIAAGFGVLFGVYVGQWELGILLSVWMIAISLWAPRSGIYVVDPSRGADALIEDERSRAIRTRAAEVGFQVMLVAATILWFAVRTAGTDSVPHQWLVLLVLLGFGTQVVTDIFIRHPQLH